MSRRPEETDVTGPTPVTIYGRTYHLRGSESGAYLAQLASAVDAKMREAAEATGTADTLKVAILAGLNLADECLRARRGGSLTEVPSVAVDDDETDRRVARMISLLDGALAERRD
jgi:cell division protein ZapA